MVCSWIFCWISKKFVRKYVTFLVNLLDPLDHDFLDSRGCPDLGKVEIRVDDWEFSEKFHINEARNSASSWNICWNFQISYFVIFLSRTVTHECSDHKLADDTQILDSFQQNINQHKINWNSKFIEKVELWEPSFWTSERHGTSSVCRSSFLTHKNVRFVACGADFTSLKICVFKVYKNSKIQ